VFFSNFGAAFVTIGSQIMIYKKKKFDGQFGLFFEHRCSLSEIGVASIEDIRVGEELCVI
jgi:hypothetical protein